MIELNQFVSKHREVHLDEELVLPYGSYLRNGMIVLIESHWEREFPHLIYEINDKHRNKEDEEEFADRLRILIANNRWCKISNLQFDSETTRFIGVYDNGDEIERIFSTDFSWIVKRDSIPK